jgi:hypothetical protein
MRERATCQAVLDGLATLGGGASPARGARPEKLVRARSSTRSLYHRAHLLLHFVQHVILVLRRGTYL